MVAFAFAGLFALAPLAACAPPPAPAASALREERRVTCSEDGDDPERLVVDWSPIDRSKLEAAARRGVVPVRVDGCRVRIVDGCAVRRPYVFASTSRQHEALLVSDRDEVEAKLPALAARFGATVARASAVDIAMTVVGRYEAADTRVTATDLDGECDEVTHVVTGLAVGAFTISTRSRLDTEAAAGFTSASHGRERNHLDAAGVEDACAGARRSDTAPPDACGIPLRVELRALRAARALVAAAPARAVLAPPSVSPSAADPASMRRAMDAVKRELAVCHRAARAASPGMAGTLTLSVRLARNGDVRSVEAKPEGDLDVGLAGCAVERVGHVVFPAGEDERPRVVVVPAVFRDRAP